MPVCLKEENEKQRYTSEVRPMLSILKLAAMPSMGKFASLSNVGQTAQGEDKV